MTVSEQLAAEYHAGESMTASTELAESISGALRDMRSAAQIETLRREIVKLPQYQPETKHYFHAGMYCREVYRDAGVALVGAIHRKAHFYLIVYGTVILNGGERVTGPALRLCGPGTRRAVYSETPVLCMTFHQTNAKTVEEAEMELVEESPESMYGPGNLLKQEVLS